MKQFVVICTLIALTACSQSRQQGEAVFNEEVTTTSIVGGTPVEDKDEISKITVQIYSAQVERNTLGQIISFGLSRCTGSIIAKDLILTAAHCTVAEPTYMFLYFAKDRLEGDMEVTLNTLLSSPQARRVKAGSVGDNWPKLTNETEEDWGDIALLKFDGGLPEGYHEAKLLSEQATLKTQQPITLAGWGIVNGITKEDSTTLRKVNLAILDPAYSETEMSIDSDKNGAACKGDSGGPAYVTLRGRLYVSGVTSRTDSKTDPKSQCIGDSIYTKVQAYLPWIKEQSVKLRAPDYKAEPIPQPFGE